MSADYKLIPAIRKRRSVRKFTDKPVEQKKIISCLEAARIAPSAENVQPWRFIVLADQEKKDSFGKKAFSGLYRPTRWALQAPVLIAIASDKSLIAHKIGGTLQKIPFDILDVGIAGEHLCLQAVYLGLGTCWIGWFNKKKAESFFDLPGNNSIYGIIAMGYPAGKQGRRRRKKELGEIAFLNEWGRAFPERKKNTEDE